MIKSKYQIYQIAKFVILSAIIIKYFYLEMQFPPSLVLILLILVVIRLLPITRYIERKIVKHYPNYNNLNSWIKRLILFAFYVVIYAILKVIIVNVIMIEILGIPVEQQISDLISKAPQ